MKSFNKSIVGSIRLPEADKPKNRDVPTGFKRVEAEVTKNSDVPAGLNAVDPYRVKYHTVKRAIKSERTFPLGFGCMRCVIELLNGIQAFGDCAIVGCPEAPTESAEHGAREAAIENAVKILCGMSEEKQKELETLTLKTEHKKYNAEIKIPFVERNVGSEAAKRLYDQVKRTFATHYEAMENKMPVEIFKKDTVDFKSPDLERHEFRCKGHILDHMPGSNEGPETATDSNFKPYVSYVFRADTLSDLDQKFLDFILASVKVFSAAHKPGDFIANREVVCQVRLWPRIRKTHVGDYMLRFRGTFYLKED